MLLNHIYKLFILSFLFNWFLYSPSGYLPCTFYFKSLHSDSSFSHLKYICKQVFSDRVGSSEPVYKWELFLWISHMTRYRIIDSYTASPFKILYMLSFVSCYSVTRRSLILYFVDNPFFLKIYGIFLSLKFKILAVYMHLLNNFCQFCFCQFC